MKRVRRVPILLGAAALAFGATGGAIGAAKVGTKANPVKSQANPSNGFTPKVITAKQNTFVYFVSTDKAPHNAVGKGFNSGTPSVSTYRAKTPKLKANEKSRTIPYICTIHPFMKGVLKVTK